MRSIELTLNDVCELIVDCEHKTAPIQETGYPSIRTPNVGRGRLILDGVNRVSEETYKYWTKRAIPRGGDLIFAREAPLGNVAIVPDNLKVCLGQRTVLIRPNRQVVEPDYLVFLLLGDEIQAKLHSVGAGATVPHVNMQDIRALPLPELPPLPTQRKIADILSAYADLIENNTRRIKLLEEMAQTIYREWFVHFRFPGHEQVAMVETELGLMPEGWEVRCYTDIIDVMSGGTPSTSIEDYWNGQIPWCTPRDMGSGWYVMSTERCITELGLSKCSSKLYPANTVFITARGTVGRCVLAGVPMAMSQTSYALSGRNEIPQEFVFLMTLDHVDVLRKGATGAVFDTIVVDTFRRLPICVPPIQLLGRLAELVAPMFSALRNLLLRNSNLRQTRDLLLPKLVSGEVEIADV